MAKMTKQGFDHTTVVSIDFGTTYSGYSYSFRATPEDVFTPTTWGEIFGIAGAAKTPTCVLTDDRGKLVAIGYKAQKQFSEMDPKTTSSYSFYSHFKMKLHTEKNLTKYTEIEDHRGNTALALNIYTMVLEALKSEVLEMLKIRGARAIDVGRIRWVITVPAIWTDGAKQFMRQAAVQAGLVKTRDSDKLILALEPEAASLWCRHIPIAEFAMRGDSSVTLSPETQYVVMDAGGGTLDITAHKVLEHNQLQELYWANGGAMGGNRVNESFSALIGKIFEGDFMDMYKNRNPSDYIRFMNRLEIEKRGFQPDINSASTFDITMCMSELYQELFKKKISDSVTAKYTELGVTMSYGKLKIPHDVMATIFTSVVNDILSHVDELLQKVELRGVKTILMVGGFSNCKVLQQAMKNKFTAYSVLVPKDANIAVLRGAVRFGHTPGSIRARVARMTYGFVTNVLFDAQRHRPDKVTFNDHGKQAENVVSTLVDIGQHIGCDEVKTAKVLPGFKDQESVSIKFVTTFKKMRENEVMYANDEGVDKIGSLTVQLPGKGIDRKMEIAMKFGGTEIEASARDLREGGSVVRTALDFFSKGQAEIATEFGVMHT